MLWYMKLTDNFNFSLEWITYYVISVMLKQMTPRRPEYKPTDFPAQPPTPHPPKKKPKKTGYKTKWLKNKNGYEPTDSKNTSI